MEPPATSPSTEESPAPAPRTFPYGFAAALAVLGSAVFVVASIVPYATSVGQAAHLVEFDSPFKLWVWSAIQLWGTSLAVLVIAGVLIPNRGHPVLLAGLLIAFGLETTLLSGPSLGQLLVTDNVEPAAGSYLGVISGLIVLSGGIVAYRTWKSTSVST
jgi:hypothetical protein